MTAPRQTVECTIPVLPVRNLTKSIRFYTDILGFRLDWGGEAGKLICSVSRDKCCIMLAQRAEPGSAVWIWIGVSDDSLFGLWKSRGVKVLQEPQNHPWAYEMKFQDIDGNVLWLGTERRTDIPLQDEAGG
jgi:predicted lactoylglutathione lyase